MKLTGKPIKSLQTALLAAFDYEQLRRMLATELGQNLEEIAPVAHANLTDMVYSVIRWYAAQPEGLHKLVTAARAANPGHQELAQVAEQLLAVAWEPLPAAARPSVTIDARLLGAAIAALVLAVAGVLYYLNLPKPMPSSGYNVAVAAFEEMPASGDGSPTEVSRQISDSFFSAIQQNMAQLPSYLQHDLRGPDVVGPIHGATPTAREEAARKKAGDLNATLLIYGVVTQADGQYFVQPVFYVNDNANTFFYGESLIGSNKLGKPIPFSPPLDLGEQTGVNQELDARRQVLQYTVQGLGYFFNDKYELAQAEFRSAANIPAWEESEGKEIIYLLQGAVALRQYGLQHTPEPLDDAENALQHAYDINPNFGRAQVGLGTVAVLRAAQLADQATEGDSAAVNQLPAETVDQLAGRLAEAQAWFKGSLLAADQEPSDYIVIKADYGLGQVNQLGTQLGLAGYSFAQARKFYEAVLLNVANADFDYLDRFAAQAHAGLGLIARLEGDYGRAAEEYRTANAIWDATAPGKNNFIKAQNWAEIGRAEEWQQNSCAAQEAYSQAVTLGQQASALGEEVMDADKQIVKWQQAKDFITQKGLCKP